MATNGLSRVLLPGSKQRAQNNSVIKPLLFGAILGALITHAFHALTFHGGLREIDTGGMFQDPYATIGNDLERSRVAVKGGGVVNRRAEADVMPHSETMGGIDGRPCLECETAIALKEVDLNVLRGKLSECNAKTAQIPERHGFPGELGRSVGTAMHPVEPSEDKGNTQTAGDNAYLGKDVPKKTAKPSIEVFVGIQSGFSRNAGPGGDYNYEDRRNAIRETWFRSNDPVYMDKLDQAGIVVKFVMGQGPTDEMRSQLKMENQTHGDIMLLDINEDYHNLVTKSREFFRAVLAQYAPKYIVKVDDDVYLKLNRLPMAVKQWEAMRVDYTGCMKQGVLQKDPALKWFEPQHALLGDEYFTHCWGSLYVLSGRAASAMTSIPPGVLRDLENEDVTMGLFMLAADMQHFDDRRLCMHSCDNSGIGLYDMPTPGLKPVIGRMHELHHSEACRSDEDRFDVLQPMVAPLYDFRLHEDTEII